MVALRSPAQHGGAEQGEVGQQPAGHDVRYVYLLQSVAHPDKRYVGLASDFAQRLKDHNDGKSPHTAKFRPWKAVVVVRFDDDQKAEQFERYLKSGSGHAFARRHLW